jgi:hypothetical protein
MRLHMPVLSEADVTGQVRSFLEAHGWRAVRIQRTVVPGQFQSGEPGQADFQFVYYLRSKVCPALSLTLWIELKKKGAKPRCRCLDIRGTKKRCTACDQKNWRDRERARGAVVWSGVNDIQWFVDEYQVRFGWLHEAGTGRGQLDLLAGIGAK